MTGRTAKALNPSTSGLYCIFFNPQWGNDYVYYVRKNYSARACFFILSIKIKNLAKKICRPYARLLGCHKPCELCR